MVVKKNQTSEEVKENDAIAKKEQKTEDREKEQLQSQVEELKKMVDDLLSAQKKTEKTVEKVSDKVDQYDEYTSIEEQLDVQPNKMIRIMSLREGGLNLQGNGPKPIRLPSYGDVRNITFEDLRSVYYNHDKLTKEGAFFILDKDAVKALYLEQDYEKLFNKQKLDKIFDLPENQMMTALEALTSTQRETFVGMVVQGIKKKDNKYTDFNKIDAINKYIDNDLDILKLAREE